MENFKLAIVWWNKQGSQEKARLCIANQFVLVGSSRKWESLTGREIEMIWNKRVAGDTTTPVPADQKKSKKNCQKKTDPYEHWT